MRTEPSERWIRGWMDDRPIVDTRAALPFWVDGFPAPTYAIDGVRQERAVSPFSQPVFRPSSG